MAKEHYWCEHVRGCVWMRVDVSKNGVCICAKCKSMRIWCDLNWFFASLSPPLMRQDEAKMNVYVAAKMQWIVISFFFLLLLLRCMHTLYDDSVNDWHVSMLITHYSLVASARYLEMLIRWPFWTSRIPLFSWWVVQSTLSRMKKGRARGGEQWTWVWMWCVFMSSNVVINIM